MTKFKNRGALPHRTVQPRPGELSPNLSPTEAPFLPLLYADAKTYVPDHVALRCPTCGYPNVHVVGLAVVKRDNGSTEPERIEIADWRTQLSPEWASVPINGKVEGDSVLIELRCEMDHVAVIELGSHKGITSTRVTRIDVADESREE